MAIVRQMTPLTIEKDQPHMEVSCTYSIVQSNNEKFLQIDTYGSNQRKIRGKKSQSIRLSREAVQKLAAIIEAEFT